MKTVIIQALCLSAVFANVQLGLTPEFYDQINSVSQTWTAGHNARWDDFTLESLQTQFGTFLDVPLEFQLPVKDIKVSLDLPVAFDSRVYWPNCTSIKEIRDQSTCGSCWAFGAAEALSDRICIVSGQKLQIRLSTQDLLTCCGISCGFGCNGGYTQAAWQFMSSQGLVTGNEFNNTQWCSPYGFPSCDHIGGGIQPPCGASLPTPKCVTKCSLGYYANYTNDKWTSLNAYSVPNDVLSIQTEILVRGPVEAAFTVYQDFVAYKTGVYQHTTGGQLGGHAIKILGWGVENSTPYWIVANSWNTNWGDKGFFKILRGSNHCGIEGNVVAGSIVF